MQEDYYAYFGWDNDGVPTDTTLKNLSLDYLIDDIKAARKNL